MRNIHFIRPMVVWALAAVLWGCAGCTNTIEAVKLNRDAQVYFEHGRYDQAMRLLEESLDEDFENSASHYWLGRCFEAQENFLKATYHYRLAVRFDPAMELAQLALVNVYEAQGQREKSLDAARNYLDQREHTARMILPVADQFAEMNLPDHAILAYQKAQEAEPFDPTPSLALADYAFSVGRKESALDALITAFKIDPSYPGLARRLGENGLRVEVPRQDMYPPVDPVEQELRERMQ